MTDDERLKKISSYFASGSFGMFSGLIINIFTRNPTYLNYLILVLILIFFILVTVLCEWWPHRRGEGRGVHEEESVLKKVTRRIKETNKIQILVLLLAAIFSFFILAPFVFPSFEILNPKGGGSVPQYLDISGHGAIPGSLVQIAIIDDLGNTWLSQYSATASQDGKWEVKNVQFGVSGSTGKKFRIYATLQRDPDIRFSTPTITVTRN
jgi:hypothetical protein